jgi:hypothetical protein
MVMLMDRDVPIFDVLQADNRDANAGKIELDGEDWDNVLACGEALRNEPMLAEILNHPEARVEQQLFVIDPETKVLLKAKLDFTTPDTTLDLKTFVQKRDKSIDQSIADAIWYEKYYRQGWFYTALRAIKDGDVSKSGPQRGRRYLMAFVESDQPHEVRLRELRPRIAGEVSMLWEKGRIECRAYIDVFARCLAKFGANPWREMQDIEALTDEEFPGLRWGL